MKQKCIPRVLLTLCLALLAFNISLTQTFVDLRVTQIVFEDPCDHEQQISVEIINDGTLEGSNIPISLYMDGELIFGEVIPGPIQPSETIQYTFPETVEITVPDYSKTCTFRTEVDVAGDPSPENNEFSMDISFYNPGYVDPPGWTTYTPCNSALTDMTLTAVVEYGEGTIFAGTVGGGIVRYENEAWSSYTVESGDLLCNSIECMMLDLSGNLWVGYWQCEGGASMYDGNGWTHYTTGNSGIVPGSIEKVLEDSEGNYWFASYDSGFSVFDGVDWTIYDTGNSLLPDNRVLDIIEDHSGRIWIGTQAGVVCITGGSWEILTTENSGLSVNPNFKIFEDSQGNLWFGACEWSATAGLSKFDGMDWEVYTPWNSGLPKSVVFGIAEDSRGNLWFGTYTGGLSVLAGDRWINYNTSNVLHNNTFWGDVMEASNGDIWIPSYDGLMKRSPDALDYLSTMDHRPTCSGDSDGRIIIDAVSGTYPVYYSIDGGNTFQTDSVFENLPYQPCYIAISDGTTIQQCDTIWTKPYPDITDFPAIMDFEDSEEEIPWYQEGGTAKWFIRSGSTPTSNTGPDGDHTTGDGQYIYVEATTEFLEWANLYSPCYYIGDLPAPRLGFELYMYGETMGDLYVDVLSGGEWINGVLEFNGDQGQEWLWSELDLSTFGDVIKLRFRARVGENAFSDIAIDDVQVFNDFSAMEKHFNTVWSGNGVDHMNFYALTAFIDDVPMQAYDEIAVFDGDYCVGMGMLTEVLEEGVNYLAFVASKNDADAPDVNGYTEGNPVTFKVWDYSGQQELDRIEISYEAGEGIFAIGEYASFHLFASTAVDQATELSQGWNIYSCYVMPENTDMHSLVQPLIDEGTLLKVQDETGAAIEDVPPIGWVFNIGDMGNTEGYKIKVSDHTSLVTTGFVVPLPFEIPLQEGWNIMGYPCESPADAQATFSDLIDGGILSKVQDEMGNAIEYVVPIGWIYNIDELYPGEGYKVKVDQSTVLEINEGGMKSAAVSAREAVPVPAPEHFTPSWEGNGLDHMNIYITEATLDGSPLVTGDEIGIFSGDLCVGALTVPGRISSGSNVICLVASMDDPYTAENDGFTVGYPIELRLWSREANAVFRTAEIEVVRGYPGTFEKMGTSALKVAFNPGSMTGTSIMGIYPNPVTETAFIRFSLGQSGEVRVETYNLLGEKVASDIHCLMEPGNNKLTWKPIDGKGTRLSPGSYILKLVAGDFVGVRRIMVQ